MSTIADVIDRIFRTYLEPPDYQPVLAFLQSSINTTQRGLTFNQFVVPEDQELLRTGILVESPSGELMRVVDTNGTDVTVNRARLGSVAATATAGDEFKFSPPFTRLSVFQAIADNIITLSPKLYTVRNENVQTIDRQVAGMSDPLAIEIVRMWGDDWTNDLEIDGKIVDFHPQAGGRALITNAYQGPVWIRYRRRMAEPTSETDTLDELGVEERWVNIIMLGAAADLLAGRDIGPSHIRWVSEAAIAEIKENRRQADLSIQLARYRDYLLRNAQKEMDVEYRPRVRMRRPDGVVVR